MANIELVIKIPEEIRLALINNIHLSIDQQSICDSYIKQAIINGTPLPKGHGRLVDADAILVEPFGNTYRDIDTAETIIEADKESEVKMIFEEGKTYQHTTGCKMTIIGRLKTYFHGECLIGERDTGELVPVGGFEENAVNWHEIEFPYKAESEG